MYSPQQRHLQRFLFIFRAHSYVCLLINNNTNRIRRTQSTLSLTGCRDFSMFDPFRTFHPSLHESVVIWTRHDHSKFIRETLLTLLLFSFRKKALTMPNFWNFLPLKETCWLFSVKCVHSVLEKCIWTRHEHSKFFKETSIFFPFLL